MQVCISRLCNIQFIQLYTFTTLIKSINFDPERTPSRTGMYILVPVPVVLYQKRYRQEGVPIYDRNPSRHPGIGQIGIGNESKSQLKWHFSILNFPTHTQRDITKKKHPKKKADKKKDTVRKRKKNSTYTSNVSLPPPHLIRLPLPHCPSLVLEKYIFFPPNRFTVFFFLLL